MKTDPVRPASRTPLRINDLIALARERSSENRDALLKTIVSLFMAAPHRHAPKVRQHFDVILSHIAKDATSETRLDVAAKMAALKTAPPGLIKQLAFDEIAIAEPVIAASPVLEEDILVQLAREASPAHLLAITKRRKLSEQTSHALIQHGDTHVLASLALNQGASIAPDAMEELVGHARKVDALQKPMIERFDLPPLLLTRMYFFVPSTLKSEILKRADFLDPSLVGEAVKTNRQKIHAMAASRAARDRSSEPARLYQEIVDQINANAVNERYLNILLTNHALKPFVLAFAYNIGADPTTAHVILKDKSWEALAIAARSAGFERNSFAKIVGALDRHETRDPKSLRLFHLYTKIPRESAERIMRFWRVRTRANDKIVKATGAQTPKIHDLPGKAGG
ncbi:MAG: hypothetical protein DHS20C05_14430 [Hyphococcus sp.]|nr:MAG: hypothetical protein DHS20C05_14430 [Marinicaulis sp.]